MIIKIIFSDPKIKQKKTKLTPPAFLKATIINKKKSNQTILLKIMKNRSNSIK
jgi:hypothetical protein